MTASSRTIKVDFLIMAFGRFCKSFACGLAAFPPNIDAGENYESRKKNEIEPVQRGGLSFGQVDAAVGCALGANGDQVFVLGEPVKRVEEKIAVSLLADPGIRGELRVADDSQTRVLVTDF